VENPGVYQLSHWINKISGKWKGTNEFHRVNISNFNLWEGTRIMEVGSATIGANMELTAGTLQQKQVLGLLIQVIQFIIVFNINKPLLN
jgi:hypothetical protein